MKRLSFLLILLSFSTKAWSQGQFHFNNRISGEVHARIILFRDPCDNSFSSVGSPDFTVQLLGGPQGTPTAQLQPLDPPGTTFRGPPGSATAGYVVPITPTVPGVPPGANASVVIRVLGSAGFTMDLGPYNVTLGGGISPPPNLQLGTMSIPCIPEPRAAVLSLAGLLVVILCYRGRAPAFEARAR